VSEHIPVIASILAALLAGRLLAWPTIARLRCHLDHALSQLRRDPLTGLLNRAGLTQAYAARQAQPFTVVLIDLDGFKTVNDNYSHAVGDQLLLAAADRIHSAAALDDAVAARLSGDEFAVILPNATDIERAVELILAVLSAPVTATIDDTTVTVSVTGSAGICSAAPGDAIDEVLRRADIAMYHAKRTGGLHVSYEPGMHMPATWPRRGPRLRDRHDEERVRP
jgi:diguanylate cyclase (GGDEF)-like protein